ncbi:MAG: hypothetical protein ACI4HO_03195 [Ruminococcus sp.]
MKKRIISIILTLCMVLSFVPATAFAAEGITPATQQRQRPQPHIKQVQGQKITHVLLQ